MINTGIKNIQQMENIAQQYLTKLRIIAKIPEYGQLDLTNNDLNIFSFGLFTWINRKISGDGKDNTVNFLRNFYREVMGFTSELMLSIESDTCGINKNRKYILLASLADKVKESTTGIQNLMTTYKSWHKIISVLESIQQDIIECQLKNILIFLPNKFKTKLLTEMHTEIAHSDITYMTKADSSTPSQSSKHKVGSPYSKEEFE